MFPRFALAAVFFTAIGCNDTAIVLRFTSDRPATGASAIDAMCVELDAGGGHKFGRRYDLPSLPLPQTLTVMASGKPSAQLIVYALRRGTEVARTRQQLAFRSASVLHVDVPIDVCQPHPTSGTFAATAAPTGDAFDAATLVPGANAASSGDLAVALASGVATRFSVAAAGVGALVGGAPDAPAARVDALAAADVDGDCRLDLIVAQAGAPLAIWRDGGDGSFTSLGPVGFAGALSVASGDVDGDGNLDLVAVGGAGAHVYLGDGAGHFRDQPAAFDVLPTDATAVAVGDLDGDGNLDVVIGSGSSKADLVRVYLNDKAGSGHFSFTPAALPPKTARARGLALVDLDGDGDLDLVLSQAAGPVRAYINRGDAFLEDRSFTLLPDQTSADVPSLLAADLDGDCLPDLVVPRAGAGPLLWRSAGGGKLTAAGSFDQSVAAEGALADDIDADGDADVLLWGGMTGVQLEVQK